MSERRTAKAQDAAPGVPPESHTGSVTRKRVSAKTSQGDQAAPVSTSSRADWAAGGTSSTASVGDAAVSLPDKGKGKTQRRAPTPEQIADSKRAKAAVLTAAAAALPGAQGLSLSPRSHSHMGWDAMEMTLLCVLAFLLGMILRDFVVKTVVKVLTPGRNLGEARPLKRPASSGSSKEEFTPVPENEIFVTKTGEKFHKHDSCSLNNKAPRHVRYERCRRCWPSQPKMVNSGGDE